MHNQEVILDGETGQDTSKCQYGDRECHWKTLADVTVPIVFKILKNKCRYVVKKELKDEAEKNTSVSVSTKTCRNEEHG